MYYTGDAPESDEGPFLVEERHLIDAIAQRLGKVIEHRQAEEDRQALEDQLHQAQKMEAVGQLAGGVAHDISNLLTVILASTNRLSDVQTNPDARESVIVIEQATHQAREVTRSLLTFGRALPADKEPVNLCEVVDQAARMLRHTLPASIDLVVETDGSAPPWVSADPTQLQQVVLNLAINARDAMPNGGTLRIRVAKETEAGIGEPAAGFAPETTTVRLTVADTGNGIPPEIQGRVFEPFFSTKSRERGTGLGLSVVHGIIKNHDGHIDLDSVLGEGSTFEITLPCIEPDPEAEARVPASVPARGQGERVLLAEDDAHLRGIIAMTLESMAYRVEQAADGLAVLDAFKRDGNDIRLLVLDADLLDRSGIECLHQLRERGITLPVIVMAGKAATAASLPADDRIALIRKPFRMTELETMVVDTLAASECHEVGS